MSKTQATKARTAPKTSPKSAPAKRSETIRQSVIYLQSVAAFNAGFDADDGNWEIAGAGGELGKAAMLAADNALHRLTKVGKPTEPEMKAKAAVFRTMLQFESGNDLEGSRRDFLAAFADELERYFQDAARAI